MNTMFPGYGLWTLALVNAAFFIFFAWSFYTPLTTRDWRSFGLFSAFVVALFAEMYGFPLSLYLLSGWLSSRFPEVNWYSHDAGHVLEMMFGWRANPHFGPFHLLSALFIGGGSWLLSSAWSVLYAAQRTGTNPQAANPPEGSAGVPPVAAAAPPDGTPLPGRSYTYDYDEIGNCPSLRSRPAVSLR
mgnify:CR=1 FL=1